MGLKTFSIIHASARLNGWRKSYETFMRNAIHPEDVEYLLSVDEYGPFVADPGSLDGFLGRVVWNKGRHCSVDAFNAGAEVSRGSVMLLNSDDFLAPVSWDAELRKVLPDLGSEYVVEVSTGGPADQRRLMTFQIISSARYQKLGYAFYPEYLSTYVDDEFTEHARRDGIVIDARHLCFRHEHPEFYGQGWDETYEHTNSRQALELGRALLETRRAAGFPAYRG